jgi:hypothetical protein
MNTKPPWPFAAALLVSGMAQADIKCRRDVATGLAAPLGIPETPLLMPKTIAGENQRTVFDDASDTTAAVSNTRS